MNRRRFVLAATISMLVITIAVAGLAFYSNFSASAFVQGVPSAIRHFPSDTQAVFGMNVKKFIASPVYALVMQKYEQEIGKELAEITAKTGVDPRSDIDYIIGASRPAQQKGAGVVIAVGTFKQDSIINFIYSQRTPSQGTPLKVDYNGATVLMIPEANKLEGGIAFLSDSEIALGDLESLRAVLDVRYGKAGSISKDSALSELLARVGSDEMFWFAGDATVLSKVPAGTPLVPNLSVIQGVFGALNLSSPINGKITVVARDEASAKQLADFARGLVALGNLAGGQNPEIAALARGFQITQAASQLEISLTLPVEILTKLDAAKIHIK
jgi:hypothetical protein